MTNSVKALEVLLFQTDFVQALEKFLAKSRQDYAKFMGRDSEIAKQMVQEYNNGLRYEFGKKYVKVIDRNSVHSFIMIEDDGKFKRGDILKAASWRTPARNFARGNIFGQYTIRWTGA